MMNNELRKTILDANTEEHKKEAKYYDMLHLELYNKYEQRRLKIGLENAIKKIEANTIQILDVGSGTGNLVKIILNLNLKKKIQITAVDLSKEMQQEMKKKLKNSNISHHLCDIDSFLETNTKKFDFVMISSVLHHLPDYNKTLFSLIKHVNKKGIIYATHEPLIYAEQSKSAIYRIINFSDKLFFYLRLVMLRLSGRLPNLKIDYSNVDYHTKEGGLSPKKIKSKLNISNVLINKYCVNYYTAKINNHFGYYNAFELIIYV
jgi:ubiquinone/menaquinone biosynthesis C-methylase UbiE